MRKLGNNIPLNQCYSVNSSAQEPKALFPQHENICEFQTLSIHKTGYPLISVTLCSGSTMYRWISNNYQLMVRAKAEQTAIQSTNQLRKKWAAPQEELQLVRIRFKFQFHTLPGTQLGSCCFKLEPVFTKKKKQNLEPVFTIGK